MLESKLTSPNAGGTLTVGVGRVPSETLVGIRDLFQVMFTDYLAENLYRKTYSSVTIGSCVRALAYKNPHMHILQIGAGTGTTIDPVLDALVHQGELQVARYYFTDHSPATVPKAKERPQNRAQHKM